MGSKAAKRQIVGFVDGIDGPWAMATGGERASAVTAVYDGGADQPEKLSSPPDATNLVFVRPFDLARDEIVKEALKNQVGKFVTTVSKVYLDRDGNKVGTPETFHDALLIRLKTPDGEAGSGAAAEIETEWALQGWA